MTRSVRRLTSRDAVLSAVELHDRLGADEFLRRYGFGPSYRYRLVHAGREYDSKAIAGVAFGLQHPAEGPLGSGEFSGGISGAAHVLGRLGFQITVTAGDASPPDRPGPVLRQVPASPTAPSTLARVRNEPGTTVRVVLVGCVKTKRSTAAPAKDLYISDLFRKRRAYAEASDAPWFILSAQHGLVDPDQVLEPYDMALKDQPVAYRVAWARKVVNSLVSWAGSLDGLTSEIHAGAAYAESLRVPVEAAGGRLVLPLQGLTQGQHLAWYNRPTPGPALAPSRSATTPEDAQRAVQDLMDPGAARSPSGFPWGRSDLATAGLYAWFVDPAGADQLTAGLQLPVLPGLIYAGQAGATPWPSGAARTSTLSGRIRGQHLGGRISASTWRFSLAVALRRPLGLETAGAELTAGAHERLTQWMGEHLRLSLHTERDRDSLGSLEHAVLSRLDPPFNLDGMAPTPVRSALTAGRRLLAAE